MRQTVGVNLLLVAINLMLLLLLLLICSCPINLIECQVAQEGNDRNDAAETTSSPGQAPAGLSKQTAPKAAATVAELKAIRERDLAKEVGRVKRICYHDKKIQIQSISDMLQVISLVNRREQMCKKRYLSAIYELDSILKFNRTLLCTEEAFELLKNYHFRFIQPMKRANRQPTQFEPLPRDLVKEQLHPEPRKWTVEFDEHDQVLLAPLAVRHFFLKFALDISRQCKRNLVHNLEVDTKRLLDDEDREVLQMFERDSPIGQALAGGIEQMDFDSVLYIPQLDGRRMAASGEELQAEGREQHLRTSARKNSALFQMINACKHRLKPIYDKLIMPIVRLSKLGYDYQGQQGLSESEQQFLESSRMKNWLVVVHVCEIFKNTHLIQVLPDAHQGDHDEGGGKSLREEMDEIDDDDDDDDDEPTDQTDQTDQTEGLKKEDEEEGQVSLVSEKEEEEEEEEFKKANNNNKHKLSNGEFELAKPIEYEPSKLEPLNDRLLIESERQLDEELAKKRGHISPTGFRGFLRKTSSFLRKMLAKLDLERFAHYRHHSLFYSGLLNFLSAVSNVAGITVTLSGVVG